MSLLALTMPTVRPTPVVVEVPHAGLAIPEAVQADIVASEESFRRDADLHVDALFADAPLVGATLLTARISRYVVDLNRAPDDVDLGPPAERVAGNKAQPRGVVWRVTTEGRPALRGPLHPALLEQRLSSYHAPYHRQLRDLLDATRQRHGHVVLIAGHSMPSTARRGRELERRADIVPGTLGRTSAHRDVIDLVEQHFRLAGLSVRHDDPYRGGYTTAHYGRPATGVHAIQIEINRGLYMDERTLAPKAGDFERLGQLLRDLVARLGELPCPPASS